MFYVWYKSESMVLEIEETEKCDKFKEQTIPFQLPLQIGYDPVWMTMVIQYLIENKDHIYILCYMYSFKY